MTAEPWWRSDRDDLDDDVTPLVTHLHARWAAQGAERDRADGPSVDPPDPGRHRRDAPAGAGAGTDGRRDGEPTGEPAGSAAHRAGDCEVCPICRGLAHVRERHPDVADHLVEAARHLTLALQEVVEGVAATREARAARAADRPSDGDGPSAASRPRGGRGGARSSARDGFHAIRLDDAVAGGSGPSSAGAGQASATRGASDLDDAVAGPSDPSSAGAGQASATRGASDLDDEEQP